MKKMFVYAAATALLAAPAAFAADSPSFPVDSTNPAWQNSGVQVKAGQHVEVVADGKDSWNIGWGDTNAAGYGFQLNTAAGLPQYHAGAAVKDWHWAALVCSVGKDRKEAGNPQNEVEIGMKRGFTVDQSGYLFFICNDNANPPTGARGYDQNSGIIHVKITVTDPLSKTETVTYDAQKDFSATENPHGAWSYGWSNALDEKVHLYADAITPQGFLFWTDNDFAVTTDPHVGYFPLDERVVPRIPPHVMLEHPGPQGQFTHCVWTAPAAGTYDIQVSFTPLDFGGPHGYLLKKGEIMGDSLLPLGQGWEQSFKEVSLAAGDTIDAALGVGRSGVYFNDETQFSLTITREGANKQAAAMATEIAQQLRSPVKEIVREALSEALGSQAVSNAPAGLPVDAKNPGWQESDITVKSGTTYDARSDFSLKQNPNGAWSYGWSEELADKVHLYTDHCTRDRSLFWSDNDLGESTTPHVGIFPLDERVNPLVPPHSMLMHPGGHNEFTHCIWTAPAAGTYDIHATVTAIDTGRPHAYLLKNGATLADGLLVQNSPWAQNIKGMSLEAGDTVDAAVGVGSNGVYYNDETNFSLTVTPAKSSTAAAAEVAQLLQKPLGDIVREAIKESLKGKPRTAPAAANSPAAASSPKK